MQDGWRAEFSGEPADATLDAGQGLQDSGGQMEPLATYWKSIGKPVKQLVDAVSRGRPDCDRGRCGGKRRASYH